MEMTPELIAAARLMEQQRFEDAAAAFERVVQTQPEHAALASMQVGAANYFLGRFDLAIQWYEHAGRLGFDPEEVANHVEEAREAMGQPSAPNGTSRVQFAFLDDGSALINEHGAGWRPFTHPRPDETVLAADGGMWRLDAQRRWVPAADGAGKPPAPGDVVFALLVNRFFTLQPDGSWIPKGD